MSGDLDLSKRSKFDTLLTNFAFTFSRLGGEIIVGILSTPLLLRALGFEIFGLLITIAASGMLVTIGTRTIQQSIARELGFWLGRDDTARLREAFSSSLALQLSIGITIALSGFVLVPLLINTLTIPPGYDHQTRICLWLTLLQIAFVVSASPFSAMIRAHQDLRFTSTIELLTKTSSLVAAIAINIWPNHGMITYVAIQLAFVSLFNSAYIYVAMKRYTTSIPKRELVSIRSIRAIMSYGFLAFLNVVGTQIRGNGMAVFFNVAYGNTITAAHSIGMRLSFLIAQITLAVRTVILPAMTFEAGAGDHNKTQRFVSLSSAIATCIAIPIAVPLMTDTKALMEIWLQQEVPAIAVTFCQLLVMSFLCTTISQGHSLAMQADGRIGTLVLVGQSTMITVVVSAGLLAMTFDWSPQSVLIAELLGAIVVAFLWQPIWVRYKLLGSNRSWFRYTIAPLLATSLLCAGFTFLISVHLESGLVRAITTGSVCGLTCVLVFLGLSLSTNERSRLKNAVWERLRISPATISNDP